ncbi:30S ribosomal protein S20 [Gammaproteobacteria bacterium]|nr:30S ribosomal protein S20 [Gammaproteobacteria bacterium]
MANSKQSIKRAKQNAETYKLRHAQRSMVRTAVKAVRASIDENDLDPIDQIRLLKNELSAYKEDLTQKVSWVVCNKIDLINEEDRMSHSKDIQDALNISEKDIFFISAATGEGTQKLLQSILVCLL